LRRPGAAPRTRVYAARSILALASLVGTACGKRETSVEAGIRTRTLHVGNGVEPQGLDPQTTTGANDTFVQISLFEPLLSHDPVTGLPAPGAAASWEISADLLTYTFKLRPEGRWSAQYTDDAATAPELLAAAGFIEGKGLKPLDFLLPNRGNARLAAEIVQEMWRKQLGVQVTLKIQEWGVYIDSENSGQFDVCYDGWNMSDPYFFYDLHRTGNPMSRYPWSNTEYDDTLRIAARAPSVPARHAAYLHMEKILAREMPVIPLHFECSTSASPRRARLARELAR
jgi:ABC-type oligopeptide transport system substrate-binding subunit